MQRDLIKLAVLISGVLLASAAQAALLLLTDFGGNVSIGPFRPREPIRIVVSLTNISPDQTVTICEGPCIGDEFTYSLGGQAGVPNGYSFFFGNRRVEDVFDGQIEGTIRPGRTEEFIFGVYDPDGRAEPGLYVFRTQLQIFDATADRVMLAGPAFIGIWEVRSVSEPATFALLALSLAGLAFIRRRAVSIV
jgi:PEP-CTERM motif